MADNSTRAQVLFNSLCVFTCKVNSEHPLSQTKGIGLTKPVCTVDAKHEVVSRVSAAKLHALEVKGSNRDKIADSLLINRLSRNWSLGVLRRETLNVHRERFSNPPLCIRMWVLNLCLAIEEAVSLGQFAFRMAPNPEVPLSERQIHELGRWLRSAQLVWGWQYYPTGEPGCYCISWEPEHIWPQRTDAWQELLERQDELVKEKLRIQRRCDRRMRRLQEETEVTLRQLERLRAGLLASATTPAAPPPSPAIAPTPAPAT